MKPFHKNWMVLWLVISIALLLVNASLVLVNSFRIDRLNKKNEQRLIMMKSVDDLQNSTIHGLDLGIRGFALSKKDELLVPFEKAIYFNGDIFESLYQQAEMFNYPKEKIDAMNVIISGYINVGINLKSLIERDSISRFEKILSADPGFAVWHEYNNHREDIFLHLGKMRNDLNNDIESSLFTNLVLQILVILLIVPSIILIFFKLNKLKRDVCYQNTLVDQKNTELKNSKDFLSHTIRGPICRLLGLFYLLEEEKVTEKNEVLEKIGQVAQEIDDITKNQSIQL